MAGLAQPLRAEFERRDWFAVVLHDPYLAMAELALREKAQSARAAWGLQRMEGLALVIVEPDNWPNEIVHDLCAAVSRWLPIATLWTARGKQIQPIDTAEFNVAAGKKDSRQVFDLDSLVAALPREPMPTNGTSLASPASPGAREARSPSADHNRLTRDEIDMLLQMDESGGAQPRNEAGGER